MVHPASRGNEGSDWSDYEEDCCHPRREHRFRRDCHACRRAGHAGRKLYRSARRSYDIDMGGAVFGIEGEYSDSTAKTEFSDGADFEGFGLGRVDTGRDLYVGARLGAKVGNDLLAYVKGGYTNTKYNVLATDGETELKQDINVDGWRAGAGLEYAMSDNMFTKIEYRYSKYSEAEFENGDMMDSDRFDIDTDRHQVVASVGMRF